MQILIILECLYTSVSTLMATFCSNNKKLGHWSKGLRLFLKFIFKILSKNNFATGSTQNITQMFTLTHFWQSSAATGRVCSVSCLQPALPSLSWSRTPDPGLRDRVVGYVGAGADCILTGTGVAVVTGVIVVVVVICISEEQLNSE